MRTVFLTLQFALNVFKPLIPIVCATLVSMLSKAALSTYKREREFIFYITTTLEEV